MQDEGTGISGVGDERGDAAVEGLSARLRNLEFVLYSKCNKQTLEVHPFPFSSVTNYTNLVAFKTQICRLTGLRSKI